MGAATRKEGGRGLQADSPKLSESRILGIARIARIDSPLCGCCADLWDWGTFFYKQVAAMRLRGWMLLWCWLSELGFLGLGVLRRAQHDRDGKFV